MKKSLHSLLLLGFVSLVSFQVFAETQEAPSDAGVYIKVGEAKVKRSLLALPAFQYLGTPGVSPNFKQVGSDLFNTVFNDLDVSSYFEFIKQAAFLEDTAKVGLKPAPGEPGGFNFENWKKIGAEFLVRAGFRILKGEVTLEAYVYQVSKAKLVLGKEYKGSVIDARRMGHYFSNDLVKALTGKPGNFLTKVVVASDRAGKEWREIFVMDWDGNDVKKVTAHHSISLSPSWSPDAKSIVYTSYAYHAQAKTRNADLFSYELSSGKRFLLSSKPGINSGAAYHPDGKSIYMTISQGGNPDIYKVNLDGEALTKITNGPLGAMNVEPSISPDGKKVAFSSDRSGQPMIYTMDLDGTNIKRMTFAGKYNATPSWSPDGKKITFAGYDKDHFDVFTMNSDGTSMERLTTARKKNGKNSNNEDPTYSPDGRQVMFISDRTGSKQIFIVNQDGTNERRITVDQFNYFKPKWSWKLD